jgi:hypothetical protein
MKQGRSLIVLSVGVLLIAVVMLAVGCGGGDGDLATDRPRPDARQVILIVVDGLRADHLGSFAGAVATPNFDALAGSAVRFDWCFAQAPDPAASFAAADRALPTTSGVLEPATGFRRGGLARGGVVGGRPHHRRLRRGCAGRG